MFRLWQRMPGDVHRAARRLELAKREREDRTAEPDVDERLYRGQEEARALRDELSRRDEPESH
jgi:hypothetical protein